MFYWTIRFITWVLTKTVLRLKVSGAENIPVKGGFILASNHLSYLDPVVLADATQRRLNFLAKEELFKNRFFRTVITWLGAFAVKRDSADTSALKESIRRVKKGGGLVLFPEGTRQTSGELGKPEPGIGFLVAKSGVPVIPAFIKGTDKAWPKNVGQFRPAKVRIFFGESIKIEKGMPYDQIAEEIMKGIGHLKQQSSTANSS